MPWMPAFAGMTLRAALVLGGRFEHPKRWPCDDRIDSQCDSGEGGACRGRRAARRHRPRRRARVDSGHAVRPGVPVLFCHPAHPRRHRQFLGLQRLRDAAVVHHAQLHRDFRGLPHAVSGSVHDPEDLPVNGEILLHRVADDAGHRLHRRLFPRLLRAHRDHADGAVSRLHDSVLDLERDPHDLVDSAARAQRAGEPCARARPCRRQAGRVAALFAILGRSCLHPSLHLLHGGADLQLDDAHRSPPDRGGLRLRAPPPGRRSGT